MTFFGPSSCSIPRPVFSPFSSFSLFLDPVWLRQPHPRWPKAVALASCSALSLALSLALAGYTPLAHAQSQLSSTVQLPAGRAASGLVGNAAPAVVAPPATLPATPPATLPALPPAPPPALSAPPTTISAAPSPAPAAADVANPYGLSALWLQGDWVAKGCLLLLALMSMASWYAMVSKLLVLRRLRQQTKESEGIFKNVRLFAGHIAQLSLDNPVRYLADAGTVAVHQYAALKPRVDYDTWLIRAIEQALNTMQTRLQGGMALLATVGTTAPFVGLFGTVWAIYTALVKIGASGQASIDRVAGPVGEALIMTAIGLAVAVPAVFGYNWLLRQNKLAFEGVRSFGAQLHGLLLATTDLTAATAVTAATPFAAPQVPDASVFTPSSPAAEKTPGQDENHTLPSALSSATGSPAPSVPSPSPAQNVKL